MPSLRTLLRPPLLLLAFLWVVLEETIWRWAKAIGGLIARIPVFAALERLVLRLDAHIVLLFFLVPIAALFPVKLGALWLIGTGHPLAGLALLFAAKSIGTAFSARLYVVAEPKLMEIRAFAWARGQVLALLARAHAFLDASAAWQAVRRAMRRAKAALHGAATRARAMLRGTAPSLLERVRAVRAYWRRQA
ncbi:hypothetical protein GXW74_26210 [Roseomonas eburnea]|uniref:Uncharacterized protein n=1 Tax=Neoroseomonas eburnea TaxID=1346889 RepID=A0A9X9XJV3_9PROT|nr:hypothetical protein [Neoroseomonas eburnea]MBR0683989.1 hypothetical protein [Neoroseomonas eburnea]